MLIVLLGLFLINRTVRYMRTWLPRFVSIKAVTLPVWFFPGGLHGCHCPGIRSDESAPRPILRVILIGSFVVMGIVLLAGPFLPRMPFKVGQLVRLGEHFGMVEAMTILNTRIRTFDGKVIYLPNTRILKDEIINYHHTPTRRVKVDIRIGFCEDLVRVKQILEELMIADARVQVKPSPAVLCLKSVTAASNWCQVLGQKCEFLVYPM